MTGQKPTFLIVGGGLAGAKAAETLREEGFDGSVVLVGSERQRPYERPPLSKEYLRGESSREELYVHAEASYEEHGIELRVGETAIRLDTERRQVELDGGEELPFDRLLIATGAEPRKLDIPGAELDGVHYLRSADSSDAIRARLEEGGKVVVVGAGWIGSEVAASARQRGLEVTMIDPGSVPLERVMGPEVGGIYRDIHVERGVELILGTGVEAFEGQTRVERVRTSGGQTIDCDFVVVGIGVAPLTDFAASAGIAIDNGIAVDQKLQTSALGVFAAGDVARHDHPALGPLRVEHWANALHQGPVAARNMLGQDIPYDRVPYFFSDQYDVGMEYSGYATSWDKVVFRGDPAKREFIAFWLKEERLLAAMNVNVWEVADSLQSLIRGGARVDPKALEDPDVSLERLAAELAGAGEPGVNVGGDPG
jgi:3-phenylpropionate/trans-cinnamate dioxygenase ferredoxin reductase subunit